MNKLTPDEHRILVDAIHDSATIIHKGQMMNDWTKSLAMQYAHKMGNSLLYNAAFIEEFAELIVRECVQTLRDNTPVVDEHDSVEDWDRGYIRAMSDCEHHIQEHFGVEE